MRTEPARVRTEQNDETRLPEEMTLSAHEERKKSEQGEKMENCIPSTDNNERSQWAKRGWSHSDIQYTLQAPQGWCYARIAHRCPIVHRVVFATRRRWLVLGCWALSSATPAGRMKGFGPQLSERLRQMGCQAYEKTSKAVKGQKTARFALLLFPVMFNVDSMYEISSFTCVEDGPLETTISFRFPRTLICRPPSQSRYRASASHA